LRRAATAAEFSFFLAIPTMLGASTLSFQNRDDPGAVGLGDIGIGFIVSFVVAVIVIRGSSASSRATASRPSPGTRSSPAGRR
jgi:undecaprenyl pyrophosphate phosphatase UppP